MEKIEIISVRDESDISKPQPISLPSSIEPAKAKELANLVRIAASEYTCFNNWFNDTDLNEVTQGGKSKIFSIEADREIADIPKKSENPQETTDIPKKLENHCWLYVDKEIAKTTAREYYLLTESDTKNPSIANQFPDSQYYKYRVLKTYEYLAYYYRLNQSRVDVDRFGFIVEREEAGRKIVFIVFRGTREFGEWFNNAKFKQINFLEIEEDRDGIEDYGKISLGFNQMYTGYRAGIFMENEFLNDASRLTDSFLRFILERIDGAKSKVEYKPIYDALEEYIGDSNLDPNSQIYISGHSLGAALATIATMHLAEKNILQNPINLYSFASPRVGDNIFADKFNELVAQNKIKAFRIANSEDLVTFVPFPVWFKAGVDFDNHQALDLARDTFNAVTGGVFEKDYQHVGIPIYHTHQARRKDEQGNLTATATMGDNHNMTVSYCDALEV